jgi:hypothetical protein
MVPGSESNTTNGGKLLIPAESWLKEYKRKRNEDFIPYATEMQMVVKNLEATTRARRKRVIAPDGQGGC